MRPTFSAGFADVASWPAVGVRLFRLQNIGPGLQAGSGAGRPVTAATELTLRRCQGERRVSWGHITDACGDTVCDV